MGGCSLRKLPQGGYEIHYLFTSLSVGKRIAERRKTLKLSQAELSRKAGVSRATLDALENGRAGELGFSKVTKLLAALGLELTLQTASSQRPTLDELMQEDRDDQGLDRRC